MARSRFAAAERRFLTSGRLPPLRTLATGDVALGVELVAALAGRLRPTEVIDIWGDDCDRVAEAVSQLSVRPRRRLVRWWDMDEAAPGPSVLMALRSLRSDQRGTWLVAVAGGSPHQAFADAGVWDLEVSLRLSPAERIEWVQRLLGGARPAVAAGLVDRLGTTPAVLAASARSVAQVIDSDPSAADIAELVPVDAGRDYVGALLRGDRRSAMASVGQVLDPYGALAKLGWSLLDLWTLSELRPPVASRPLREVAEVSGLPRWSVDELVPLVRRYPRARVLDLTEAVAIAHRGLSRAGRHQADDVLVALAAMWCARR